MCILVEGVGGGARTLGLVAVVSFLRTRCFFLVLLFPLSTILTASTQAARPTAPVLELAGRYHNALKLRWSTRPGCDYELQMKEPQSSL